MGILDKFTSWMTPQTAAAPASASSSTGVRSPWAGGTLSRIVLADVFGLDTLPVNRAEAMSVPAIQRARHLLCVDAGRCPLELHDANGRVEGEAGAWLQSTKLTTSPQHRAVWTVDDLIFYGWSLWLVKRDGEQITDAARCPIDWWEFDKDGRILVNKQPANSDEIVLIPGYHEGIINSAAHTIRGARQLERIWQARAANPVPAVELHQTTADELDDDEIRDLVDDWRATMQDDGGAVGWTPQSIDVRVHGEGSSDLLIQGRNASAVDGARVVGVPASMVDASNVNSTLTYETLEGRGGEYADHSLPLYLGPIEARLSLDDVCAPGQRVRANTSALITTAPPATGTTTED